MTKEIHAALHAICEGYPVQIAGRYIIVENPDFQEDNGSNPNLVIDVGLLLALLDPR